MGWNLLQLDRRSCLAWVGPQNRFDAEYAGPLTRPRRKRSNGPGTVRAQTICKRVHRGISGRFTNRRERGQQFKVVRRPR